MVITGYMLDNALRWQSFRYNAALQQGPDDACSAIASKIVHLRAVQAVYNMINHVSIKTDKNVVQSPLGEALDFFELHAKLVSAMEAQPGAADPVRYREAVNLLTALEQAVAEGQGNRLETNDHEIACDPELFR